MKNLLVLATAAVGWCAVWASSATAAPTSAVVCKDPYTCPKVYAPLCDDSGRIYSNRCMMESAACQDGVPRIETPCPKKLTRAAPPDDKAKVIDCKSPFVCNKIYAPVCDDSGRIYSNLCMMQSASCDDGKPRVETPCPVAKSKRAAKEEEAAIVANARSADDEEGPVCRKRCFKILTPVCGSDGFQYGNKCLLDYEACRTEKEIKVVSCATRRVWKMWVDEEEKKENEDM